ncbi:hypothetical protein TcWFU_007496 [Taenia crassiceps]|uniref:Uncharacterized protein n=1 Tax=Taenia crassiceps TaxID=6207 RepID=A0ABR4QHK6_9CEST
MSAPVQIIQPHSSYLKAFNEYYLIPVSNTLSAATITAISVGGYQSAYDTDEALGHSQLYTADEALRFKTNGHPDVKPELFI